MRKCTGKKLVTSLNNLMNEIKWEVGGKIYRKYNEISSFLFSSEGRAILENDARKSLNGEFLSVENGGHSTLEKLFFGKSYTEGYMDGFQRGFREGAQAMESEMSNK